MNYIRLLSGDEIDIFSYSITNCLIVKFINKSFSEIKEFFGDSVINTFQFLDMNHNLIEEHDLRVKISSIRTESGRIKKEGVRLVAEEYDENIEVEAGLDNEGNPYYENQVIHHEAQYAAFVYDEPTEFTVVVFERPSIDDKVLDIQSYVGMTDITSLDLNGWKNYKQEENKKLFAKFLEESYVEYEGKKYGVTEEDQNEMSLNYMQYSIFKATGQDAVLEWHAKKEKCEQMTEQKFLTITMMVKAFVYPYFNLMQEYKEQIFACKSIGEVRAIDIRYGVTK